MLLKFTNSNERSTFYNGKGKTAKVTSSRIHRKTLRIATKPGKKTPGKKISFGKNQKSFQGSCKNFPPTTTTLCDNSNDSGLGFDESHHHHPTLALNVNNNNSNSNLSNALHHRPLSTLRYSDAAVTAPCTVVAQSTQEVKLPATITGRKSKNVPKLPTSTTKVKQTLTPPTQNEDTCNSDDFSSFYQASSSECKTNLGEMSPSDSFYQSSPEKRSSPSGSDGSSPSTSDSFSPNPSSAPLDNPGVLSPSSLHKQFMHVSREGAAQLQIITQPEQQHRARYQTEGSRGAVKDRSGNGFPVVKLNGYNKPTILQVFIGNDIGRVSPHIFYQACKVSGKNSTPCSETKTEGTMVIEIELKPENDMTVICDCVGILKERNVDVEHRLGRNHTLAASVTRNKKKSTKCRMVFRAKINEDAETPEVLQICSNTITCTQPPGVPEICKKSLDSCSVVGGRELFIIGKNFLKDTKVTFVQFDESRQQKKLWEETVQPDKEYLQQTHLICVIPSYPNCDSVQEPVHVQIYVTSSSKKSEAHNFIYMPLKKSRSMPQSPVSIDSTTALFTSSDDSNSPTHQQHQHQLQQQQQQLVQDVLSISWNEPQVSSSDMMPPPLIMPRSSSFSASLADTSLSSESTITLKTEFIDQTQSSSATNGENQQNVATSTTAGLQTTVPVSVKEMIFNDGSMTRLQNPFVTQDSQALMTSSQVQDILNGFKMQTSNGNIDLNHIKSEQSPEQVSSAPNSMLPPPPPPPPQDITQSQQQQVVENLLNLIVQSTIVSEPSMVVSQNHNHHHISQDIVLNSPSTVTCTSSQNIATTNQVVNSSPNMISPSMMCGPSSMMTVQMVQDEINSLEASIENSSASEIMSNAVSDATAETQAVVKQIFAQAAAEMFSDGSSKSQTTINNFMLGTNILTPAPEHQQLTDSQQLQRMLVQVQELNAATSMMQEVKEEKTNVQPSQERTQCSMNNSAPTTAPSTTITQPFSPTTQDLTAMSESDLISFINPSVFM